MAKYEKIGLHEALDMLMLEQKVYQVRVLGMQDIDCKSKIDMDIQYYKKCIPREVYIITYSDGDLSGLTFHTEQEAKDYLTGDDLTGDDMEGMSYITFVAKET